MTTRRGGSGRGDHDEAMAPASRGPTLLMPRLPLPGFVIVMALSLGGAPRSALEANQTPPARAWGDTARVGAIDAAIRRIDEEAGDWRTVTIREDLPGLPPGAAAEVRLRLVRGQPAGIVARVTTEAGRYSIEYYLMGGSLLLAYETLEYAPDRAPPGAWRNAAGNAAWERRTWFLGDGVLAARTIGPDGPAPGEDGERLAALARALAARFPG